MSIDLKRHKDSSAIPHHVGGGESIKPEVRRENTDMNQTDSTQAIKAHNLYRDLPFTLEQWQEEILCTRIADLLHEHEEVAISSVLRIRCMNHMAVPQQNANEHSGGECGACIAEERDALKAKCEAPEKERDATWDALMEVETTFPEPWFSVGTPSDFAKHIKKRVENLKAKCEALERDYSALMTSLNAASKFACDMEKSQAGRIEALEKQNAILERENAETNGKWVTQNLKLVALEKALRDLLSSRYSADPGAVAEATERAGAVLAGRKGNPQGV